MRWMTWALVLVLSLGAAGCGAAGPGPADGDAAEVRPVGDVDAGDLGDLGGEVRDAAPDGDADGLELLDADAADAWVFDAAAYEPVLGWILLDSDPKAVADSIDAAAARGATHIQLSHDLIMNVEDVLGDSAEVSQRVQVLSDAIARAHSHGMKAYVWAHELSGVDGDVCFSPADSVWEQRRDAYRAMFARLPDLDGVVMMFGSAPVSPWFSACTCDWCVEQDPDAMPFTVPPVDVRLRTIVEQVGQVIVNEQGRELFVRTFVHQPQELPWHSEGLSAVQGVAFTGMHKGPVQDWQPYNPHHANTGAIGPHPSVIELDVAGEYYGRSILPWCAPGYYRYRLRYAWDHRGIGAVLRVERGSDRAVGTPNEVNLYAIERLHRDRATPLAAIWDGFLDSAWGIAPGAPGQPELVRVLEDTFPIRRKSHYALGIWALEKGSDLPSRATFGQLNDRGRMPKWDPDWQAVWERVSDPDPQSVRWIWQEGSEALQLATEDLATFDALPAALLTPERRADLRRRLVHQLHAARAWRDVDLFLFARKAASSHPDDPLLPAWIRWAYADLAATRAAMLADGLDGVALAGPASVQTFLDATAGFAPSGDLTAPPEGLMFSPIRISNVTSTSATLRFSATESVSISLDYGLEIPDYGTTTTLAAAPANTPLEVQLEDLQPGQRYVARLRAGAGDTATLGGDFWIFTEP